MIEIPQIAFAIIPTVILIIFSWQIVEHIENRKERFFFIGLPWLLLIYQCLPLFRWSDELLINLDSLILIYALYITASRTKSKSAQKPIAILSFITILSYSLFLFPDFEYKLFLLYAVKFVIWGSSLLWLFKFPVTNSVRVIGFALMILGGLLFALPLSVEMSALIWNFSVSGSVLALYFQFDRLIHKRQKTLENQYLQTFNSFKDLHMKPRAQLNREIMIQELLQIPIMLCDQTGADAAMMFMVSSEDPGVFNQLDQIETFPVMGYNALTKSINLRDTAFHSALTNGSPQIVANDTAGAPREQHADQNEKSSFFPYLLIIPIHSENTLISLIIAGRSSGQFSEDQKFIVETLSTFYSYLVSSKITLLGQFERHILNSKSQLAGDVQSRIINNQFTELEFSSICLHTTASEGIHSDYHGYYVDPKSKFLSAFLMDITGRDVFHTAQAMIMLRSLFQILLRSRQEASKIMKILNGFTARDEGMENYAHIALLQYNHDVKSVYFTSAGSGLLLIYRLHNQEVEIAETGDLALGVDEEAIFSTRQYQAASGDIFLTCTDGLLDVVDERDQIYGKDRLIKILKENYYHSPHDIKEKLFQEQSLFRGRAKKHDDKTVVILKIY